MRRHITFFSSLVAAAGIGFTFSASALANTPDPYNSPGSYNSSRTDIVCRRVFTNNSVGEIPLRKSDIEGDICTDYEHFYHSLDNPYSRLSEGTKDYEVTIEDHDTTAHFTCPPGWSVIKTDSPEEWKIIGSDCIESF
jgi:hypothetical protein